MARKHRRIESNVVYHVFNRRTDRQCLFPSEAALDDFLTLLREGRERYAVRNHAYCLMSTHWHLAVSAEAPPAIGQYLRWLATKHAVQFRFRSGTRGNGHVYQDRYKSVPVNDLVHYLTLIRYIEGNALSAHVVKLAEHWRWSSLSARLTGDASIIEPGPWHLPSDWQAIVNAPVLELTLLQSVTAQVASFRMRRTFV